MTSSLASFSAITYIVHITHAGLGWVSSVECNTWLSPTDPKLSCLLVH